MQIQWKFIKDKELNFIGYKLDYYEIKFLYYVF